MYFSKVGLDPQTEIKFLSIIWFCKHRANITQKIYKDSTTCRHKILHLQFGKQSLHRDLNDLSCVKKPDCIVPL